MPTTPDTNNVRGMTQEEIASRYEQGIVDRMYSRDRMATASSIEDIKAWEHNAKQAFASEEKWRGHYEAQGVEEKTGLSSDLFRANVEEQNGERLRAQAEKDCVAEHQQQQVQAGQQEELDSRLQQSSSNSNDVSVSKSASKHL